jgi:hypothetical protein
MLLSGIGKPYDPVTSKGVVGKNYCYQLMSGVQVFVEDEINPFIGVGTPAAIDYFQGDNFDHGGLGFFGGAYINPFMTGGRPIQVRNGMGTISSSSAMARTTRIATTISTSTRLTATPSAGRSCA